MANIKDVAKLANVSISTVSLALNGSERVSVETRRRIKEAASSIGYSPNPLAQGLKAGRSRLIGMVIADLENPFYARMLKLVENLLIEHQYLVVVAGTGGSAERERTILETLSAQRVSGIILSSHCTSPEDVAYLKSLKIPMVLVDHKVDGLEADFIGTDSHLASAMLTERVIRFGHKRIAHLAGVEGLWTAEERKRGFRDTMKSFDLDVDESLILHGDYDGNIGYKQAMRMLVRRDRPTAVMAANNVMALGALQAMRDLGIKCPEEVSLTSIDDVPWSKVIEPQMTMVVQDVNEIAEVATRFLIDRISAAGADIAPREHILVPQLVVGQSVAPPLKNELS